MTCFFVTNPVFADTIVIKMDVSKPDGRTWDVSGGAPDPYVIVNGHAYREARCQDRFTCSIEVSESGSMYIQVVDADAMDDDYDAGSTSCSTGNTCRTAGASITVL